MAIKVHSFDVFDTALIRKVAVPTDVFRLLGLQISEAIGVTDSSDFAEDFLCARVRAEQQARLLREEPSIEQIWENLHDLLPLLPAHYGPHDELNVERKLLLPNAVVARHIANLRSSKPRIIFTSDTYLPEEFIREQLFRYNIAQQGDGIYVSSAIGVTKGKGGLFQAVLKQEKLSPAEIHHYGDNPHNDIAMARRFGIGATQLTSSQLTSSELAMLSKDLGHRMSASQLTGSMRAFRLSANFRPDSIVDQLVTTFLGPALMVWAAWVLKAAQRDGVRRLYFVSRQGHLLCKAARILAPDFGNIECRDLLISRKSVLLPSVEEIGPTEMSWLRPPRPVSLREVISKLGLHWSDVEASFAPLAKGQKEFKLEHEKDWAQFWDIIKREPVAPLLKEQIQDKRAKVLAYLRAEGLCDGVPVGIVDIGWYMAVQTCLQKLLGQNKKDSTIRGYFLGLCRTRMPPGRAGKVTALFYEQAFDHHSISPDYEIFKRIDVLDHVFGLAPHGTVSGYQLNGSAVAAVCPTESDFHVDFVGKLGDAVEAFCESNRENASHWADSEIARGIMEALISALCKSPNQHVLTALEHIIVTDGTDGVASQSLLQSWRGLDAAKMLIPGRWRNHFKIRKPVWPEVAQTRSKPIVRLILLFAKLPPALKRVLTGRTAVRS